MVYCSFICTKLSYDIKCISYYRYIHCSSIWQKLSYGSNIFRPLLYWSVVSAVLPLLLQWWCRLSKRGDIDSETWPFLHTIRISERSMVEIGSIDTSNSNSRGIPSQPAFFSRATLHRFSANCGHWMFPGKNLGPRSRSSLQYHCLWNFCSKIPNNVAKSGECM